MQLTPEDIENLRRSLAMAPTLPADQLAKLLEFVAELLDRGCCRGSEDAPPGLVGHAGTYLLQPRIEDQSPLTRDGPGGT